MFRCIESMFWLHFNLIYRQKALVGTNDLTALSHKVYKSLQLKVRKCTNLISFVFCSPGQAETNGGLYCWKDSDVTRATNQSCLTREEHPPNMMSTTAGDHNNTDDNPGNETTAAPATKMAVKRCMTYTNYTSSNDTTLHWLPAGSTNSSKIVQSNLVRVRSCDFDGLCDNKTLGQRVEV